MPLYTAEIDGPKLKNLIQRLDLLQADLAEASGYSDGYISYLVNGKRQARAKTRTALRKALLEFGASKRQLDQVIPPPTEEEQEGEGGKAFVWYLRAGTQREAARMREAQRWVNIGAAIEDMFVKDYVMEFILLTKPSHPLAVIRAAKAAADAAGVDLETWVRQQTGEIKP